MTVTVMNIRVMGMPVCQPNMLVIVSVRLGAVPQKIMLMPVVFVMGMLVAMRYFLVRMLVLVMLGQMQPDAHAH